MHLRAHLPESLLVDSGKRQGCLILLDAALGRHALGFGFDAFGQGELDRMRVAQRENNLAALHVGLITDADDVHLPRKAFGNSANRVVGQRPRQAMQRSLIVRGPLSYQLRTLELESNSRGNRSLERALRAFYLKLALANSDRNAFGKDNRFFSNTRHNTLSDKLMVTSDEFPVTRHPSPITLVDFRQQLAADIFLPRHLTAHQSARGRDDVHAIAAQHARDLMRADINTPPRPRHSRQVSNRGSSPRVVTQKNADDLLHALAFDDEVVDIAFFFENAGDFQLQFRRRDIDARMLGGNRVPNSRQHVGNRISHSLTPDQVSGAGGRGSEE